MRQQGNRASRGPAKNPRASITGRARNLAESGREMKMNAEAIANLVPETLAHRRWPAASRLSQFGPRICPADPELGTSSAAVQRAQTAPSRAPAPRGTPRTRRCAPPAAPLHRRTVRRRGKAATTFSASSQFIRNLLARCAFSASRETGSSWRPPRTCPSLHRWSSTAGPDNVASQTRFVRAASDPPNTS